MPTCILIHIVCIAKNPWGDSDDGNDKRNDDDDDDNMSDNSDVYERGGQEESSVDDIALENQSTPIASHSKTFFHEEKPSPLYPEMKKGHVKKLGKVVKNWKVRYFVLDKGI